MVRHGPALLPKAWARGIRRARCRAWSDPGWRRLLRPFRALPAEGSNAAAGFAGALAAGQGAAAAAARQLVQAALNAARRPRTATAPAGNSASWAAMPPRDIPERWTLGGLRRRYALTAAAVEGARAGQDSHSPSKKFQAVAYDGANGYIIGTISSLPKIKKAAEDSTKAAADAARRAAQQAAAEAEAARQAAVLPRPSRARARQPWRRISGSMSCAWRSWRSRPRP